MSRILFDGWSDIVRTAIIAPLAYGALILVLRIAGKRTLSKMNAFDLVVTVALGSTLATILLTKDVALVEGTIALGVLVALQYVVSWLSVRAAWFRESVRSEPTLLVHRGEMLREAMKAQRVTEDEVLAAARKSGVGDIGQVASLVLESDGTFSVTQRPVPVDDGP